MTTRTPVDEAPSRDARTAAPFVRRALLAWFRRSARDLPWRRTRDPYRIWLSEIMLQQTRVETVLPYYERFTRTFPRVQDLAAAPEDRVLKLWEGLGYYTRARNLHKAAQKVVDEYGGRLPTTAEQWQRLPGIGRYTAGAIASIAFGECVPVLDGNVKRVLTRLFGIRSDIEAPRTVARLWQLAADLVSPKAPGDFNQAMMELGATVCTPRRPRCSDCPLRQRCTARARGGAEDLPVRRQRTAIPHHEIVAAVIRRNGRWLLGKRPPEGLLGGLWELPGGKVEPGETHEQALAREVREELGLAVRVGPRLAMVDHAYSHFAITLHVYECRADKGRPRARYHTAIRWVPRDRFDRYALPAATLKALRRIPL